MTIEVFARDSTKESDIGESVAVELCESEIMNASSERDAKYGFLCE